MRRNLMFLLSSQSTRKSYRHTHHIYIIQFQSYTCTIMHYVQRSQAYSLAGSQGFGECHVPNCTCRRHVGDGRDPCVTCGHAAGFYGNCKRSTISILYTRSFGLTPSQRSYPKCQVYTKLTWQIASVGWFS